MNFWKMHYCMYCKIRGGGGGLDGGGVRGEGVRILYKMYQI